MNLNYQMWCFDLDGTLINQSKRYIAVHQDLISEMGGVPASNYCEKRRAEISEASLFKSSGITLDKLPTYDYRREQLLESRHYLRLDTLFPGTLPILRHLKAASKKVWIVTHRAYAQQLAEQLEALGLAELLSGWNNTKSEPDGSIIGMSDQGRNVAKYAKAEILAAFSQNAKTVMVGDSPTDIKAAHEAQVQSIAIPTGLYGLPTLKKENPTYIFNSLEELHSYLSD